MILRTNGRFIFRTPIIGAPIYFVILRADAANFKRLAVIGGVDDIITRFYLGDGQAAVVASGHQVIVVSSGRIDSAFRILNLSVVDVESAVQERIHPADVINVFMGAHEVFDSAAKP